MSSITIDPKSRRVILKIARLSELTREGVEHGAWQAGRVLKKNTSADILAKPKSGKVYTIRTASGRRRHVASAPGETHANRSGALRRSLGFSVKPNELEFGYFNGPDYAEFVESGTSRMKPRPSIQNNIRKGQRDIETALEREIKDKLR